MCQNEIISAIENLKVVRVFYNDGDERIVEPHILYKSSSGNTLLDAYQTSGYSESNEPVAWKIFNIEKIQSIESMKNIFTPRQDYNPDNQKRYMEIIAKVPRA